MSMKTTVAGVCVAVAGLVAQGAADYPIRNVDKTKVRVTSGFWYDRLETNRTATLKSNWQKCNETPRVANFTNAANRTAGTFGGIPFDDSDVYKVVEGSAYVLAAHPDPKLEQYVDWFIGQVAKAQEPDGYLYTARTLGYEKVNWGKKDARHLQMMGPTRWSNIASGHELYNVGHMYEAAVAWYEVTGKRNLLDVAIRSADLVDRTFGPGPTQLKDAPGHEEIELALVKLYRATKEPRYLKLARHFIEMRGLGKKTQDGKVFAQDGSLVPAMNASGAYNQNHMPAVDQREAVGHAVRANYLYSGMADVAALTGDRRYLGAITAIWQNVVAKKLHLNGGTGGRPAGEAYADDYELPNNKDTAPALKRDQTYLETCAAIANALWNDRMFRMYGESKFVDVLERVVYNGFISGVSLSGDAYFYPNPLAAQKGYKRSKWFGCSCCPVNIVRFVPQVPSFAYASKPGVLYWNLFMEGEADVDGVKVAVKTRYPWSGDVELTILDLPPQPTPSTTSSTSNLNLKIRIPGWAVGRPVPSDLYVQTEPASFMEVLVEVNGSALNGCPGADGYVSIGREWKKGDVVKLTLPMPVKRIKAHDKVSADRGKLAVEKGPIVYCAEGVDNGGKAYAATLPADATFSETEIRDLCERMLKYIFKETMNIDVPTPFPCMPWDEAMGRFGSDKPDLRFGMELIDIADICAVSEFTTFASVAQKGGWVRGINAKGCGHYSRRDMDKLKDFVAVYGAKGLAYISVEADGVKSPIAKFFTEEQMNAILERMNAEPGDMLMFVAADMLTTADALGHLRCEIAQRENLIDPNEYNFLWVVDFPMFEWSKEDDRWKAMHHPFTMPKEEDLPMLDTDPGAVRAQAYDCVLNGCELGGGSIRIHSSEIQQKIFEVLKITPEDSKAKFGYLLEAFGYGAPPHGGLAFGLDRMIMLMGHKDSIRDVIAFPKTQSATDMMTQAPDTVTNQQLRELHIKCTQTEKDKQ